MYLIFNTEKDAIERADIEGVKRNLSYFTTGEGTRFMTKPRQTEDGEWALEVTGYSTLTEEEEKIAISDVLFPVEDAFLSS